MWELFGYLFWLGVCLAVYSWLHHSPSRRPGPPQVTIPLFVTQEYLYPAPEPPEPSQRPRILTMVADNPADHPYDEIPLTTLVDHLHNKHWEVLNMVAESGSPSRWRKEHAADHGLVMR